MGDVGLFTVVGVLRVSDCCSGAGDYGGYDWCGVRSGRVIAVGVFMGGADCTAFIGRAGLGVSLGRLWLC